MQQLCENCILFDWITFTIPEFPFELIDNQTFASRLSCGLSTDEVLSPVKNRPAYWWDVAAFLGLSQCDWKDGQPSSLMYEFRAVCDGISIHYTSPFYSADETGRRRNKGFCIEMSGQGSRYFETYGKGNIYDLLTQILFYSESHAWKCTRLDLAFDDFSGLIDIEHMAAQAQNFEFTARSQTRKVIREAAEADPHLDAISIVHGSKSSNLFIRCYDKRLERNRLEIPHWIRLELQFRQENAMGIIEHLQRESIGHIFSGVLANYLNYRDPDLSDSNKRRWPVSDWWQNLIRGIDPIQVAEKKTVEYNRERLEHWVYGNMLGSLKTMLALDGDERFIDQIKSCEKELPEKYLRLLREADKANEGILQELGVTNYI